MIFSMRGGAIALTLVRLAGSDGVDRGAHVVELGGRHLSLVRQAKDEAFGIAHVEAENTAPEQAVGAVHMREFGERGLRRVLALGQRLSLAAAEAAVPAAVAAPGRVWQSVVSGKSAYICVDTGGRRHIKLNNSTPTDITLSLT